MRTNNVLTLSALHCDNNVALFDHGSCSWDMSYKYWTEITEGWPPFCLILKGPPQSGTMDNRSDKCEMNHDISEKARSSFLQKAIL